MSGEFSVIIPPSEWIDEWFMLWPEGVKSGGYYVRSDKSACLKKMIRFCNDNPHYTRGIIIVATKNYIDYMREGGYKYMKLAPYFINKDGLSMMEGYCGEVERIKHKPDNNIIEGTEGI